MKLVLMDFDGTITTRDTMIAFITFTHGKARMIFAFIKLLPNLIAMKFGLQSNEAVKLKLLKLFYSGWQEQELIEKGRLFHDQILMSQRKKIIKNDATKLINQYLTHNHKVVIVTASADIWVKPWTDSFGLDLLSTKLDFSEGRFNGKLAGRNCNYDEKVKLIKNKFELSSYDEVIAYGDSRGDLEMLGIADKAYYKHFKK